MLLYLEKGSLTDVTKFNKGPEMERLSGLSRWTINAITVVLIRERQRKITNKTEEEKAK